MRNGLWYIVYGNGRAKVPAAGRNGSGSDLDGDHLVALQPWKCEFQ
jgi:hypothetical protein